MDLERTLSLAFTALGVARAVVYAGVKAVDAYASWALSNEDPSDDERALRARARAHKALDAVDWLDRKLPILAGGVRS